LNYDNIISELNRIAIPKKIEFKRAKFGIVAENALGIMNKDLNDLVKRIPKDDELAVRLFDSGIYEARLLCSKIFNPKNLTEDHMEKWVKTFENWEICDAFCMGVFARSKYAISKISEWSKREKEFEKRSAFATMAGYCMADKKADNNIYESFYPILISACDDNRLYVKKAVNWALRSIGKRNIDLNKSAINCAKEILRKDSKTARWIASNALKELEKEDVRISDYPRSIYRSNKH